MCHGDSWSNRTHMFCFVSPAQCIVNGLAFVDSKVPLIPANYLCGVCTCLFDSLWAPGQSRGWALLSWHTCAWHPHSAKHRGSGPINRLAPSDAHWVPALRALLPVDWEWGWHPAPSLLFFAITFGSVLRHSDLNYKEDNLSGAQLRK